MSDVYRFTVDDTPNPWVHAIEIQADDPDQAYHRAESWLFARRDVGTHPRLVQLELEQPRA